MPPCTDDLDLTQLAKRLTRRARRLGAQPCDAEDMAQEAVLRLITRGQRAGINAPEHYAMIILQNIARARWRARVEHTELEEESASVDPIAESRLALNTLHNAIARLPDEQAQVMQLVLEGEVSPRAIAGRLDLPVGTVMSRLARARAKLRVQIGLEADAPVSELL
jgi:RNA polymerase sigma-70 factor (ECF subfamily)